MFWDNAKAHREGGSFARSYGAPGYVLFFAVHLFCFVDFTNLRLKLDEPEFSILPLVI